MMPDGLTVGEHCVHLQLQHTPPNVKKLLKIKSWRNVYDKSGSGPNQNRLALSFWPGSKYNQLLRIEEELPGKVGYAGRKGIKGQ